MNVSRVKGVAVAAAAALALSLLGANGAGAAPAAQTSAVTSWTIVQLAPAQAARLTKSAKAHLDASGGTTIISTSLTFLKGNDDSIAVSWRLSGGRVSPSSSTSVYFTPGLTFRDTSQVDFVPNALGGGTVRSWHNGSLVKTDKVTAAQMTRSSSVSALPDPNHPGLPKNNGSSNCGIALSVALVLSIAAVVACVGITLIWLCPAATAAALIAAAVAWAAC